MSTRLIASGRDSDIYEYGPDSVLKRTRKDRSLEREARVMQYAEARGFPVPRVLEVRAEGTEIIMERVDGDLMMDAIAKRPHTMRRSAGVLADLHDGLHELRAPDWLPTLDDGNSLLHLDLHPLNVIMADRGPLVIDWSNAACGHPLTDVGLTYVLLTCPQAPVPPLVQQIIHPFRILMARAFTKRYRGSELDAHTAFAAELKTFDPNMQPDEVESCRRLAERLRARSVPARAR